jgi:hypothetical protein
MVCVSLCSKFRKPYSWGVAAELPNSSASETRHKRRLAAATAECVEDRTGKIYRFCPLKSIFHHLHHKHQQHDTVITHTRIHPRVRIMHGGAYGHIRVHM